VMVLAYAARVSTKDVDAIFHPASLIRDLAAQIGASNRLPIKAQYLVEGLFAEGKI
jgi:hypothetical protein